jgi:predicted enzyme related to lactoylglutathione lyase
MAGDPPGRYYVAKLRGRDVAGIAPMPPSAPGISPTWMTHIAVDSVDEAADRARDAGGSVLASPVDAPPAGRMAVLSDPSGAGFCVWEAGARRGAQLVNEPSAWAMSALSTPDPEGAEAFYAALFGWQTEGFGPEFTLFRLPGYVGGEPEQPVARDVVAAMSPGNDAGWNVDLWVADADATAAKARELGGRLLVEPREVPGFRNAVIADPFGASLSVSQLLAPPR